MGLAQRSISSCALRAREREPAEPAFLPGAQSAVSSSKLHPHKPGRQGHRCPGCRTYAGPSANRLRLQSEELKCPTPAWTLHVDAEGLRNSYARQAGRPGQRVVEIGADRARRPAEPAPFEAAEGSCGELPETSRLRGRRRHQRVCAADLREEAYALIRAGQQVSIASKHCPARRRRDQRLCARRRSRTFAGLH